MRHNQPHSGVKGIQELHLVVDFQMLMVDMETLVMVLLLVLVLVLTGLVAPMVADPVHLVDIVEEEWVDMEHMVAVVPTEEVSGRRLLLGILAVMAVEPLVEATMLVVDMEEQVKVMEDMVLVAVDMAVDMVPLVLAVGMEEIVQEVQCMEAVEEAMVVLVLVLVQADTTLMEDRK